MKSDRRATGILIVLVILALGCAGGWEVPSPVKTGPSLKISGSAYKQGQPVADGIAMLVPSGYHVLKADTGGSGLHRPVLAAVAEGEYSFADIDTGYHNLIIREPNGWAVFAESLYVSQESRSIQACSLYAPGAVRGMLSDSLGPVPESTFVYIRGTPYSTFTDSVGWFRFERLPTGIYRVGIEIDTSRARREMAMSADSGLAPIMGSSSENPRGLFLSTKNEFYIAQGETLYEVIEIDKP